ncbi:MAG: LptF/LptG family permease [Candidatus Eisenbacteria bacterium]|nr:LptF/LptG family permease [Candidatus Eisenbacteria bacterium]
MFTLSRYILKSHIAPALAGLAIFYFVLSMDFIVDYLNLFIAKGVPGFAVLEGFVLSLAWMTVMAVPMAVMVSVLTAFGRLAGDNEITAVKASGLNVFALILPVLFTSVLVAVGVFWFGNHVLPAANYRLKVLLVDIHRIRPLATIEPGILTELPGGYTIIVDRLDPVTSEVFNVRIHKLQGEQPLQTIVASRGHVSTDQASGLISLELFDGEVQEVDPDDPTRFNRLLFDRHVINLEQQQSELSRTAGVRRGDRELSLAELKRRVDERRVEAAEASRKLEGALEARAAVRDTAGGETAQPAAGILAERTRLERTINSERRAADSTISDVRRLEVEYHKKMSIPFACVVFVLLGAPLGIRSKRGGIGIGAGTGTLFFLVYYLFLVGGEQLGDRGFVSPFWAMWAPNILFGGLGVFLTAAVSREWRVAPIARAIDFILRPPQRVAVQPEKK